MGTDDPEGGTDDPVGGTDGLGGATDQPEGVTEQPEGPKDQPEGATEQPDGATDKLEVGRDEPKGRQMGKQRGSDRKPVRPYFDGPSGIRTQDLRIMSPADNSCSRSNIWLDRPVGNVFAALNQPSYCISSADTGPRNWTKVL